MRLRSRTLITRCVSVAAAALPLCAGLAVSALLAGCGSTPPRAQRANPDTPVNTGLRTLGEGPALALPGDESLIEPDPEDAALKAQIEESARQLSVYFANLEINGPGPSDSSVSQPPPARSPQAANGSGGAAVPGGAGGSERSHARPAQPNPDLGSSDGDDGGVRISLSSAAGEQGIETGDNASSAPESAVDDQTSATEPAPIDAPEKAMDPAARRDELAQELVQILTELMETSDSPGSSAVALASLETILPKDIDALVDQGVLSDAEKASLDAARSLLRAMQARGEIASPAEVSDQLEQIKQSLDSWAGLAIKRAALCTSVQGYGKYETFPSYRFIAGRRQEVIVYTELERFAQRESTGPDGMPRYTAQLSQRLELYHVADDLNTWNRAAETVTDESRNRMRDYYLTNQVQLPPNLGVGRYHLKIVMRDLVSEKVAEAIIPIEIVAR